MLKSATPFRVEFCELVEHPGGSDGGEFPKYEVFELGDGCVTYSYGFPVCPCDAFCDDDPDLYNDCPNLDAALDRLKAERDKLLLASQALADMIETLNKGRQYETVCTDETDDEGEYEGDDEGEYEDE